MSAVALALTFAIGCVIMAPVGPVSLICIRRALLYGPPAGIAAGAGDAVAVALYATLGVTGGAFVTRVFAPYATAWHLIVAVVLVGAAVLIWRSSPAIITTVRAQNRATLVGGFAAALALALANPADIVLFAAIFAGLGIAVHSPLGYGLFFAAMFAGGCAYWIALTLFLNRWRAGLTGTHISWLNRACAVCMILAAVASVASLTRTVS